MTPLLPTFFLAANLPLGTFDPAAITTNDAKITLVRENVLRVETGHRHPWPSITLTAPQGKWDWSRRQFVELDVKNVGAEAVTVSCRVDNPGADGVNRCITEQLKLEPGASGTLRVTFTGFPVAVAGGVKIIGMRGTPGGSEKFDPANVTQLVIFVGKPKRDHLFEISRVRVGGEVTLIEPEQFFPFIDEFGQFIHREWPGKVRSESDFHKRRAAEEQDIAAHPGPTDRNRYGGWASGPQLKATGFFRVEKHEGKWWLVDPDGRLFWSHGVDCVREQSPTPVSHREHYFRHLPPADSPFYSTGYWAPHGYYKEHTPYKMFDFSRSNLRRKYGEDFLQAHAEMAHRRLRSWGMNTIANWSAKNIYLMRRTPYTATISPTSKPLAGSQGYWGQFPDVFDPSFRQSVRGALQMEKSASANDPWCIGYFVHNELGWGSDTSLAVAALCSPPEQPAKKVFLDDLKAKYESIAKLNEVWGTQFDSWEALQNHTKPPDTKRAGEDLRAFYTKTAETYFSVIREELKKIAPHQLYLGCRFAWVNDRAARAAAKFCDVVSYNRYDYSAEHLRLPGDVDYPLIIGEFHFGALDRGMFHTGLRKAADQEDRARKYRAYVESALRNPFVVGTHWFEYRDQATTGRGDGENYQIGLVDICDTPYAKTIAAVRAIGEKMFQYRLRPH